MVTPRCARWGASSETDSSCPLGAHTASGVRHHMPARIEGGDERLELALSIESGQPTRRLLAATKMTDEHNVNNEPAAGGLEA